MTLHHVSSHGPWLKCPFSSDEALQIGQLLSLSQLKCPKIGKKIVPTIYQISTWNVLFWKIWLVPLKLTLETGVNLKTSSSSGSNHFHTKLRGIYDLLSIIKQTNQANSSTQVSFFFLQFCKMHLASLKITNHFGLVLNAPL